ncbi:hypothetical protein NC653_022018 [Populus alba x Populus x berolinensis]|uniref:Uncharacterized protein n=1 Tax=Populus alba x Populus x berolinensis TaxID=444605 RepID=A0AAD6QFA0_9ROSI|nr:hypothetical protein NC653_022018 [Populus alba x Populus x berolinensis]
MVRVIGRDARKGRRGHGGLLRDSSCKGGGRMGYGGGRCGGDTGLLLRIFRIRTGDLALASLHRLIEPSESDDDISTVTLNER